MTKRIIASIVLLIILSFTCIYAVDFSYSAKIENNGDRKYKAVRLTSEIYNNISENMADLVLYDKENEPIPYFFNSFTESDTEINISYEMKNINSFVKDDYFYYDYALKILDTKDVIATSIEVQTNLEGFAKKVEILGGYDNLNWEKVQDDTLYNVDGNRKLEINFDSTKKYTFYRFKLSNNLEKVSFSSVILKYNKRLQKKEYFSNSIPMNFTTKEDGSTTVIKIQNLKNLKLNSLTLKTDNIFKRNVTFDGSMSKMLYNLEFESTKYKDLTIPLYFYRVTADNAEIRINNKDDKPIKVQGIEVEYLVDELVFGGTESSEYSLSYGNSEISIPKSYDISNYKEQILNEGYDVLTIKETKKEKGSETSTKSQYDYKFVFNIVILLVAVVLGIIILRKLRK